MIRSIASRALGLPRGRFETRRDDGWVVMPDGNRLHHVHQAPVLPGPGEGGPTLLLRTPYGASTLPFVELAAWIAEHGYHVVVQDVRGRNESEGRFVPFESEGVDGGATLDWLAAQPWCDAGRIALAGPSYLGVTAWAAMAARPQLVRSFAGILTSRDLHATFHPGGVFSLANSLEWAAWIGEKHRIPDREIDLERGLDHRPVREGDRVAHRQIDWYRDWYDHPRLDTYWEELSPELPESTADPHPQILLIAGWYDFFLKPALRDYHALRERGFDPELLIGPWSHGRSAHRRWRRQEAWLIPEVLRELLHFLGRTLASDPDRHRTARARVRYFDLGENAWKRAAEWPPAEDGVRLHLHTPPRGGRRGTLADAVPGEQTGQTRLRHDPDDPVPSLGGARFGRIAGAVDQRAVEARADVACFTGPVQRAPLRIAGAVGCRIVVVSDGRDLDVHARLVLVEASGAALNLCDGVARACWRGADDRDPEPRWIEPGEPTPIDVELGEIACTLKPGARLRLDVASSAFPRFERNPEDRIFEWRIVSDAAHPSWLELDLRA